MDMDRRETHPGSSFASVQEANEENILFFLTTSCGFALSL